MQCLHCAISELMMARQAQGEKVTIETVGKLCEVIADLAASQHTPAEQQNAFAVAGIFLLKFEADVASGAYTTNAVINDPNGHRQARH